MGGGIWHQLHHLLNRIFITQGSSWQCEDSKLGLLGQHFYLGQQVHPWMPCVPVVGEKKTICLSNIKKNTRSTCGIKVFICTFYNVGKQRSHTNYPKEFVHFKLDQQNQKPNFLSHCVLLSFILKKTDVNQVFRSCPHILILSTNLYCSSR